jgi:hypothetical protein
MEEQRTHYYNANITIDVDAIVEESKNVPDTDKYGVFVNGYRFVKFPTSNPDDTYPPDYRIESLRNMNILDVFACIMKREQYKLNLVFYKFTKDDIDSPSERVRFDQVLSSENGNYNKITIESIIFYECHKSTIDNARKLFKIVKGPVQIYNAREIAEYIPRSRSNQSKCNIV